MKQDDKEFIASQLETIAEDVRKLPDNPMDIQIDLIIKNLFEDIMCQLRDHKRR